jgi:hypothetical protein
MALVALAAAITIGMALGPTGVGAHVGGTVGHLWQDHIRPKVRDDHYTKSQSNDRYARKGDNASASQTDASEGISDVGFSAIATETPGAGSWLFSATTTLDNSENAPGSVQCRVRNTSSGSILATGVQTGPPDDAQTEGTEIVTLTGIRTVAAGQPVVFECQEVEGTGNFAASNTRLSFAKVNAPG